MEVITEQRSRPGLKGYPKYQNTDWIQYGIENRANIDALGYINPLFNLTTGEPTSNYLITV